MAPLRIDRLALSVPSMSEADAGRLAQLVADGLAAAGSPLAAYRSIGALDVGVEARDGERVERLAERIVDQVLRQIALPG